MTKLGNSLYELICNTLWHNELSFNTFADEFKYNTVCCWEVLVIMRDGHSYTDICLHVLNMITRDFERACRHSRDNLL